MNPHRATKTKEIAPTNTTLSPPSPTKFLKKNTQSCKYPPFPLSTLHHTYHSHRRKAETPILYETLQKIDPTIAAKWHPKDHRKIRRSLEIYYSSGCTRTASEVYAAQRAQKQLASDSGWTRYRNLIFWVHAETDVLKNRLDGRVDKMIASGMWQEIEEMKAIYDSAVAYNMAADGDEVDLNSGIWQSIGFKEFLPFLEMRGKIAQKDKVKEKELEEVKDMGLENMKTATRQYARSQVKWIRIKFLNALGTGEIEAGDTQEEKKKTNKNGDIFLLDSTDAASFPETVSRTAVEIAKGASSTKIYQHRWLLNSN